MRHARWLTRPTLSIAPLALLAAGAPAAMSAETAAPPPIPTGISPTCTRPSRIGRTPTHAPRPAIDKLTAYQGTLGHGADAMLKALVAVSDLNRESARLYVYTSLASDQDVRVTAPTWSAINRPGRC